MALIAKKGGERPFAAVCYAHEAAVSRQLANVLNGAPSCLSGFWRDIRKAAACRKLENLTRTRHYHFECITIYAMLMEGLGLRGDLIT